MRYSVLVVWNDGNSEFLQAGSRIATFTSLKLARASRDFLLEGIADEAQSISVVRTPKFS